MVIAANTFSTCTQRRRGMHMGQTTGENEEERAKDARTLMARDE